MPQTVLGWRRIQLNPLHQSQPSRDFVQLTLRVLEWVVGNNWSKQIQRLNNGKLKARGISYLSELAMVHQSHKDYFIEEVGSMC